MRAPGMFLFTIRAVRTLNAAICSGVLGAEPSEGEMSGSFHMAQRFTRPAKWRDSASIQWSHAARPFSVDGMPPERSQPPAPSWTGLP